MESEKPASSAESPRSIGEEIAAIPYEPLLPIEKWLIASSLMLGVILLGALLWLTATYFPTDPASFPKPAAPGGPPAQARP